MQETFANTGQSLLNLLRPGTASLMRAYQCALVAVASALLLAASHHSLGNPVAVFGLAVLALVAERGRVKLGNAAHTSISILPTVFAAAVFGPLAAMLVA